MPSPLDIVLHTPLWVWPLFALVLWLGWAAHKPRTVHPLRLAALPLVGLGVTIAGVVQSAMPAFTVAGWLVGLLLAVVAFGGGGGSSASGRADAWSGMWVSARTRTFTAW